MATTTFTLTNGAVTITGGGLIATGGGTSSAGSADAFRAGSAQKIYFEYTYNVRVSGNTGAGFGMVGAPYSNVALSMVLLYSGGQIYENGGNTGVSLGACVNGDVICYAVDFSRSLYWVRKNAGPWNNNAGANPVNGLLGRAIPFAYVSPVANFGQNADQITGNFGASAFAQAVPSGYTSGWSTPADPSAMLETSFELEIFDANDAQVIVSQVGVEVFRSTADLFPSALFLSQAGLEVFVTTANVVIAPPAAKSGALLIGL